MDLQGVERSVLVGFIQELLQCPWVTRTWNPPSRETYKRPHILHNTPPPLEAVVQASSSPKLNTWERLEGELSSPPPRLSFHFLFLVACVSKQPNFFNTILLWKLQFERLRPQSCIYSGNFGRMWTVAPPRLSPNSLILSSFFAFQ